jgi:hypothetical protein
MGGKSKSFVAKTPVAGPVSEKSSVQIPVALGSLLMLPDAYTLLERLPAGANEAPPMLGEPMILVIQSGLNRLLRLVESPNPPSMNPPLPHVAQGPQFKVVMPSE